MSAIFEMMVLGLEELRRMLLRHLDGLNDDQWDWRPYPQCFSIRQTLRHLILDDRAALDSLQTGKEPDYDAYRTFEGDLARIFEELRESQENLIAYLRRRYADAPPETDICIWGVWRKLPQGIAYLSSEDFYHTGQIAFIRQASDPTWNYYQAIYGVTYPDVSPNPYP